jgi:hypothetical protein
MLGAQRQGQPLGSRVGFQGQCELRGGKGGREGRLLRCLAMVLQRGRREPIPGEDPLTASIIDRLVITLLDNPGQFAHGERVGHGQPHDVLLDRVGETCVDGGSAARMWECAPIDQAKEPSALKAPEIAPQSPIAQPRDAAVLGEGRLLPSYGPNRLVARERVAIGLRITEEEVELEHRGRLMRHRFLLPHQVSAEYGGKGSYYA